MAKKDGGQAFPEIFTNRDQYGNYDVYSCGGMKLRDYFAGQSLTGIIAGMSHTEYRSTDFRKIAELAYQDADAMIAEKEKQENENPANS